MSDNSNLITSKALVNDEFYWKFRRKVTPCVSSESDPLVRFKMTPRS